jgi:2-polyprenyl-6-methoxyphenol hydroxylase-like FAD-dependent oxidoreductase
MSEQSSNPIPVLIVGAGPVGLALAGDLGWRGVGCRVIEQTDGSIYQPRQDLVGVRTMEFCRRWGLVSQVEAAPYPRDYPQDNVYVTGLQGWELGRYPTPSMADERPPPQSPQKRERCPQNMFDPILHSFATSFDGVEIRYHTRFVGFEQDADGVTVEVEDLAARRRHAIRARFLVGCDGANSAVRTHAGIAMEGNPALTYTTNVIFRCDGFEALHDKARAYRYIFIDKARAYRYIFIGPEGTWATVVAINGRDEWRFSIIGNAQDDRTLGEDDIRAAIGRAVGVDFDYEILSVLPWTRRQLVASRYREGRVFVAGDSAHAMSPTGGFGMNTGIGDAVDLSWKRSAEFGSWAGPRLLESYDIERRPVAHRNVDEAADNLGRMRSPGHNDALLDDTVKGAAARERVGLEISEAMLREWNTIGIHLGYRYDDSPICQPDGTPTPADEVMTYTQTARPGARAPHVWLADGRSTLDLFGRGFTLLRLGKNPPDAAVLAAAAVACGLPLDIIDVDESPVLEAYGCPLVLVRPDGHVAWRGDAPPGDTGALFDRLRGDFPAT